MTDSIKMRRSRRFRVWVARDDCEQLYRIAYERGMPPEDLIEKLLHTVMSEDLTDAVLDDKPESESRSPRAPVRSE